MAKSINIEINIKQNNKSTRDDGYTIMEKFINAGIQGSTLQMLNDIRMNMQVTYVLEISTAKGDEICN